MSAVPPVVSQIGYPGAGDVDDCWVVATVWAAIAADPTIARPTVLRFRAAAHKPDRPGPTGGNLDDVIRGASQLWPHLRIARQDSTDWAAFAGKLHDGWSASLAVLSSALPVRLQHNFRGPHQVGVVYAAGEYRLMNPLAHNGAAPAWIEETELRTAARAVAQGHILAALFEPAKGGTVALPIYLLRERPGTLTVKPNAKVTGWRPKADGSGWEAAKIWNGQPFASPARFDAVLARLSGRTVPASLLRVVSGFFDGLYVSSAEVDEAFDPDPASVTTSPPATGP
jgi:hypothetical protein